MIALNRAVVDPWVKDAEAIQLLYDAENAGRRGPGLWVIF
jgi:hypothetical protein